MLISLNVCTLHSGIVSPFSLCADSCRRWLSFDEGLAIACFYLPVRENKITLCVQITLYMDKNWYGSASIEIVKMSRKIGRMQYRLMAASLFFNSGSMRCCIEHIHIAIKKAICLLTVSSSALVLIEVSCTFWVQFSW